MELKPSSGASKAQGLYKVKVRRMRTAYRDILTSVAAGEKIFQILANTAPLQLVEYYTLAWTGKNGKVPALRREGSYCSTGNVKFGARRLGSWYFFSPKSPLARILSDENRMYFPDSAHEYPFLNFKGNKFYFLLIGNLLLQVVFDESDELAVLSQQRSSFVDFIIRTVLDARRRELRHLQDQMAIIQDESAAFKTEDLYEVSYGLLAAHAEILETFFGFLKISFGFSRDLALVLFPGQEGKKFRSTGSGWLEVDIPMNNSRPDRSLPETQQVLEFPLFWGSNNEEQQFSIRLVSVGEMNSHIRREMQLSQAIIKIKSDLEVLFEQRYRKLRMEQDYAHFKRCKTVRAGLENFDQIRDHVVDALPEYAVIPRTLSYSALYPQGDEWKAPLAVLFVDPEADPLIFKSDIRLKDLNDYKYFGIQMPENIMVILRSALRHGVDLHFESDIAALVQFSTCPNYKHAEDSDIEEKVLYFNDTCKVSVLLPQGIEFHYKRMQKMAEEYLESAGEGITRLFQAFNLHSGIPNRTALMQILSFLVNQVQYAEQVELEVSSIDIVRFKIFNELFGHPFGDKVIRHIAQALYKVKPGGAFHVSGDEFYMVQCYTKQDEDEWVSRFFKEKGIVARAEYLAAREKLERIARGIPVEMPLTLGSSALDAGPLGSYSLVDFISNFFSHNSEGKPCLKEYSRTGRDYYQVIHDPQRKIQALVDKVWTALQAGTIALENDSFRAFVLKESDLGSHLNILPRLTIGTVTYNHENVLQYPSDIVEAADANAGKQKK